MLRIIGEKRSPHWSGRRDARSDGLVGDVGDRRRFGCCDLVVPSCAFSTRFTSCFFSFFFFFDRIFNESSGVFTDS